MKKRKVKCPKCGKMASEIKRMQVKNTLYIQYACPHCPWDYVESEKVERRKK